MSRKTKKAMTRREALKTVGAYSAVLTPLGRHLHPLVPLQEGEEQWTPRFLSAGQDKAVTALCEAIIPETDTPGAGAAKVNQYVDFVLSQEDPQVQQAFLSGLEWIDDQSQELFETVFSDLTAQQQQQVLTAASAERVDFFNDLKKRTVEGYYTSEVGLVEELGYRGKIFLSEFPGCQHPEHHNWKPK